MKADDLGLASFLSARCNGIVGRVRDGRRCAVQTDDDTEDGDEHGDDGAEGLPEIDRRRARIPGERRAGRLGVARRARVAGEKLEKRGQLLASPDRDENDRRSPAAVNGEGRRAQDAIEPGLGAAHVGDVVERDFLRVIALEAHEPEVREEIAFARTPPVGPPRPALPQQTLPFRQLHGSDLRAVSFRLSALG